ncbi:hypothetical protein BDZ94DRAFT_1264018 [Collybia nuda]|uniref:Uncharacterized protein n=1 Tax=Collybia nuda TaxID=64659 RepID=A0A9P5Y4G0_9AGAR|nr:hypothetical protein BDZ94DRAFT_1264018 [Collybia nuda]
MGKRGELTYQWRNTPTRRPAVTTYQREDTSSETTINVKLRGVKEKRNTRTSRLNSLVFTRTRRGQTTARSTFSTRTVICSYSQQRCHMKENCLLAASLAFPAEVLPLAGAQALAASVPPLAESPPPTAETCAATVPVTREGTGGGSLEEGGEPLVSWASGVEGCPVPAPATEGGG